MSKTAPVIEKARLLRRIERERADLALAKAEWLTATTRLDHAWLKIIDMRKYLVVASSAVAIYSIRHPNKFIRWSRRALSLWGTLRLLRSTFIKSR
ncbi:MAG: YqjK-like family protein [Rouxiella aceris]|uniref:Cell division protein FtsH n=1 Tax=Rouxiella aceris TaxID=2703884 RepID=A0A848MRJ4_9GAMM|nr:YqjK-like family protein [Rouxiella aceris]MDR3430773.1 YqjK-like family protein [Rouxiella aceris]NMP28644.1 cell division protein FtsH [Rouxiella aceris]